MRRWVCSGRPARVSSGFATSWATFGGNAGAPGEDSGAEGGATPKVGRWPRTTPGSSVGGARERYPRRRSSAPHLRGRDGGRGRGMMRRLGTVRDGGGKNGRGDATGTREGLGEDEPGVRGVVILVHRVGGTRGAAPRTRRASEASARGGHNTSRKSRDGASGDDGNAQRCKKREDFQTPPRRFPIRAFVEWRC